jgi:hypothetical protein
MILKISKSKLLYPFIAEVQKAKKKALLDMHEGAERGG